MTEQEATRIRKDSRASQTIGAWRAGGRRVWARIGLVLFALAAVVPLSVATYDTTLDTSQSFDAVIVLGAAIYRDKPSPVFAARLDYARDLFRAGRTDVVIVTGGLGDGETWSEAEVGRNYLAAHGVASEVIMVEPLSRTTFENVCNAAQLTRRSGLTKLAVISDPLHLRRALVLASDAGLDAAPAGTPYTRYRGIRSRLKFTLRESYFLARRLIGGRQPCRPANA